MSRLRTWKVTREDRNSGKTSSAKDLCKFHDAISGLHLQSDGTNYRRITPESIEWFIKHQTFSPLYDLASPTLRMRDNLPMGEGGGRCMGEEPNHPLKIIQHSLDPAKGIKMEQV